MNHWTITDTLVVDRRRRRHHEAARFRLGRRARPDDTVAVTAPARPTERSVDHRRVREQQRVAGLVVQW